MPEQELNLADVGTLFEQVTGKSVAQRMGWDGFRNLRNQTGLPALQLNRQLTDVLARKLAREEPIFRLLDEPPCTQDLEESLREHNVAIFLPFALLDPDDHTFAVDRGRGEGDGLGDTQPGRHRQQTNGHPGRARDQKSTHLNSSHRCTPYA